MKKFVLLLYVLASCLQATAQVSISVDNSGPDPSAMLDVKSTDKGFLPPRMTTEQMNGIVTPPDGLIVYNSSVNSLYWFNGSMWKRFNEFNYTETDPVFVAHPAYGITNSNITNWNSAYSNRITGASGTAPLNLSITGNQLTGSMTTANSTTNGYLTSIDWNTFNSKQNALILGNVSSTDMAITGGTNAVVGNGLNLTITKGSLTSSDLTITGGTNAVLGSGAALTVKKGNLTEATSTVLTITSGTNSVLGTGTSITVKQANTSQSGYLSNTDWNTFNNKQSALTFGNITSSDITVSGGIGAVKGTGAGLTINKGNLTETGSSVLAITGGGNSVVGTGTAIQVKQANTTQSGYLSSTDWNSFNNKVSSQWTANGQKLHYNIGNVGIGTSDPQNTIDIAGNSVIGLSYSGASAAPVNGLLVEGKVGIGTSALASSAALDVTSSTAGVLIPRMTFAQRASIVSPVEGLMLFCTNCGANGGGEFSIYTNGYWFVLSKQIQWNCGAPFTINHMAGVVAPVNKTVVYWTVMNIPGETSKCWITQNLGASQQANAVNDVSEASAGWYWQFNLKQGYAFVNGTRVPNSTWITSVNVSSDWAPENDPCTIELGSVWRIPTHTEWDNVENTGAWTNWNGPWNSGLKLHTAGMLDYSNGGRIYMGTGGTYWSNTQSTTTTGWYLHFNSSGSYTTENNKTYGNTIRCLRDN